MTKTVYKTINGYRRAYRNILGSKDYYVKENEFQKFIVNMSHIVCIYFDSEFNLLSKKDELFESKGLSQTINIYKIELVNDGCIFISEEEFDKHFNHEELCVIF